MTMSISYCMLDTPVIAMEFLTDLFQPGGGRGRGGDGRGFGLEQDSTMVACAKGKTITIRVPNHWLKNPFKNHLKNPLRFLQKRQIRMVRG